jgi:hypothetical protein
VKGLDVPVPTAFWSLSAVEMRDGMRQPPCCFRRLSYANSLPEIVALKSTANS